jgi:hypothetical protein
VRVVIKTYVYKLATEVVQEPYLQVYKEIEIKGPDGTRQLTKA